MCSRRWRVPLRVLAWIVALGSLSMPAVATASCYGEGQRVTLTGTGVEMMSTTVIGGHAYRYAGLKLARPICYRDAAFGDVSRVTVVSIEPAGASLDAGLAWVGRRIALEGAISHIEVATQPPSPSGLLLWDAKLRP
jgi:hypothetical protein